MWPVHGRSYINPMVTISNYICYINPQFESHDLTTWLDSIIYTVKPVLTTTSEQRPPVNNGQPDPQTSQINASFIGGTSE